MPGNRSQTHEKLSSQQITFFLNFCFNDRANATVFGENNGKLALQVEKRRWAALFMAANRAFRQRRRMAVYRPPSQFFLSPLYRRIVCGP
ncbi:hypothetical protein IC615_16420 [Serratia ureilytica]